MTTTLTLGLFAATALIGCGEKEDSTPDSEVEADADTDTDADSDTDSDTDADSDTDTDADADADSDTDSDTDTDVEPTNLLANAGFEDGWDGSWLIYPAELSNYAVVATGDGMYPDDAPFTANEGSNSLKVYGQFTGWENETPIYQEFSATAGETYTFSGNAYMYGNDAIAGETTRAVLWIKYFDDSYNYLGETESTTQYDIGSTADTWTSFEATGTVPDGATKVQASIEFWHCEGEAEGDCYDGGGVYFDDMLFYKHSQ